MMHSLSISAAATWLAIGLVDSAIGAQQEFRANQYIIEYASGGVGIQSLDSKGDIQVRKTYSSDIFNGASIETTDFDIDTLSALPEVANVWRNNIHRLEPLSVQKADSKPLDSIVHNTTGVSKLHDAGLFGEGAVVGIVDTGVWYEHPAVSLIPLFFSFFLTIDPMLMLPTFSSVAASDPIAR